MTRRLLLLLGLAVLGVILNHSAVKGFNALFDWNWAYEPEYARADGCDIETRPVRCPQYHRYGTPSYWALSAIRRAITFGVPAFLLVSGYFIAFAAGRKKPKVNWPVLKTRIVTLVIPYLVWSIIIFILQAVVYRRGISSPVIYLQKLLTGGAAGAYYYIPLLVQLYLLSPLLVPVAKKNWKLLLVMTAVIQLTVEAIRYLSFFGIGDPVVNQLIRFTPIWFFPRRIFWFALGIVFGFHFSAFKPTLVRMKNGLVVATVAFFVISLLEFEVLLRLSGQEWIEFFSTISSTIYAGLFILAFLSFEKLKLPYSSQLTDIGARSFGIYLIHEQVLEAVGSLMFKFTPGLLGVQIVYQPIMIISSLAVPLIIMSLVSRTPQIKKFYKYSFG